MNLLLAYTTALLVGSVHALDADHMAAVTAFAVRRPHWREAAGFGLRWALGHGAAVVLVGAGILLIGVRFPDGTDALLERLVGFVLIGLGAWTVWSARRIHAHEHVHGDGTPHVHLHSHAFVRSHDHRHGATAVGVLHGLAGSAPAVALVPVASFDSAGQGIVYLLLFAVGTAAGMALYAMLAGLVIGRAAVRSERLARGLGIATGCITMAVGAVWLIR